jgi:hypothetical protein
VALNGLSVTKYEVKRPKEDKLFLVASVAVDARLVRRNDLDELANAERDNIARATKGKETREAPVSLGGVEGREYEVRGADASVGITRIFIRKVGGRYRAFQFTVAGKSIQPDKGDAARFLDSFRVNAPPLQRLPAGPSAHGPPGVAARVAGAVAAPPTTPGAAVTNAALATAAAGMPLLRFPEAGPPRP